MTGRMETGRRVSTKAREGVYKRQLRWRLKQLHIAKFRKGDGVILGRPINNETSESVTFLNVNFQRPL